MLSSVLLAKVRVVREALMKDFGGMCVDAALRRVEEMPNGRNPLEWELAFTREYRRWEGRGGDVAGREAACMGVMFPRGLLPIETGDLLAGRVVYPLVGLSPEPMGFGYYCRVDGVRAVMEKAALSGEQRTEVEEMLAFWGQGGSGRTSQAKVRAAYPAEVAELLPTDEWMTTSGIAFPLYRIGGSNLNYQRLLELGLPGLKRMVEEKLAAGNGGDEARGFYHALLETLGMVERCFLQYARQVRAMGGDCGDRRLQDDLLKMGDVLEALTQRRPETLREAMQLFWLYAVLTGTWNYGRLDVYLAPFYKKDVAAGVMDEAGALALLESLWRLMNGYENQYNNRVTIGGVRRANEADADAVALLALEATRRVVTNQPQLTMRFYVGQNPKLMDKALTVIGEGRTFPLIYNDDVNVPAVMTAFGASREEAEQYLPYGCGEYILDHRSIGSPNGVINLTKCLEAALRGGVDGFTGRALGVKGKGARGFETFEELWGGYCEQLERHLEVLAQQEKIEYDVLGREVNFPLMSLLFDDCVERGRGLLSGGVARLGGIVETYGNINAADSLTAIQEVVYRQKKCTLEEVVAACDGNFEGFADIARWLKDAPKYGNDDAVADAMAVRVHEHVCAAAQKQAQRVGLDTYLVVIINNWANVIFGKTTGASSDGRKRGEALANANNPAAGEDRNGATAFLNSLVKLDPALHAGAVQNMKFSRGMFTQRRPILEALLRGYFRQGGAQAMITVLDRNDLEAAMREPEKWGHLMVRVGGFSARFIDLPREAQLDVLSRTLHE